MIFQGSDLHPFLKPLEENWQEILAEYQAVADMTGQWPETYLHNGKWDVFGICLAGKRLDGADLCPTTARLVFDVPGLFIAGFSILRPGCVITPHTGYTSSVWRSHLGLLCQDKAWIEVAGERHTWAPGKVVVFDDTQLHHAANESDGDRVVLIVDFKKLS